MYEARPWGWFRILSTASESKVKLIHVNANSRLSLQKHLKRKEVWVCTKGVLGVHLNGAQYVLHVGESITIPIGAVHRAFTEAIEAQFIEVQTGTYFGEDDIIRIEDDYGRE